MMVASIVALGLCFFVYSSLSGTNNFLGALFLLAGFGIVILSGIILLKKFYWDKKSSHLKGHTMVDSLKRVFKVVTAEG